MFLSFWHNKSGYLERVSSLDFKDARFGHSDVVLSIFSDEYQKVPPVSHQQKCLTNEILVLLT